MLKGWRHGVCILFILLVAVVQAAGCFEYKGENSMKDLTPLLVEEGPNSIGSARMEEDGTIVLQLRAEGSGGLIGDALLRYPPNRPEYNNILRHLGGLKKGEVKQVPPWPVGEK